MSFESWFGTLDGTDSYHMAGCIVCLSIQGSTRNCFHCYNAMVFYGCFLLMVLQLFSNIYAMVIVFSVTGVFACIL